MKHTMFAALVFCVLFTGSISQAAGKCTWGCRNLILALDGIPYDLFIKAQAKGMFKDFKKPSRMVAPYPALSAYSWAQIFDQTQIDYYQGMHYNWQKNKVLGSILIEATELIIPDNKNFDYLNRKLPHHVKSYVTEKGPLETELKEFSKQVLSHLYPINFYIYSAVPDSVFHTHTEDTDLVLLGWVDKALNELQAKHIEKYGVGLDFTIVSDHGNTIFRSEKTIAFKEVLKKLGFRPSKSLKGPSDVVAPISGFLSSVGVFIKDQKKMELFEKLSKQYWVDLVMTIDKPTGNYIVAGAAGSIIYSFNPESDTYRIEEIKGEDPLKLNEVGLQAGSTISGDELFEKTKTSYYPDSLTRIRMGLTTVNQAPTISVSTRAKYDVAESKSVLDVFRSETGGTHGALDHYGTMGVLASTNQEFPDYVPSYKVGPYVNAKEFKNTERRK